MIQLTNMHKHKQTRLTKAQFLAKTIIQTNYNLIKQKTNSAICRVCFFWLIICRICFALSIQSATVIKLYNNTHSIEHVNINMN